MNKQEWLNWRKIGSSDAPIIMGKAPKNWEVNTPRKLWTYMIEGRERIETAAMKMGKEREEETLQWFENELGFSFERQARIQSDEYSFMTATLDGLAIDKQVYIEIKNCSKDDFEVAESGKVPEKYIPQLQHGMKILKEKYGIDRGFYGCRNNDRHKLIEVKYDEAYVEKLIEKEGKFWKCYLDMEEPELHEYDFIEQTSEKWTQLAVAWVEANEKVKSMEKVEENLRQELINLANNQNAKGAGVQLTKMTVKGAIDYSKVPELKGVDLNQFRKAASNRWRLSATGV